MSLAFECASPAELDEIYARVVAAGFEGEKEPWDAFWGQRYALLGDPDGVRVNLYAARGSSAAPTAGRAGRPRAGLVRTRDRGSERVLEPVECDVELFERVVEVLGDERDRSAQRRHRREDVLLAGLRQLDQRRAPVVGIAAALDLPPPLEPGEL